MTWNWTHASSVAPLLRDLNPRLFTLQYLLESDIHSGALEPMAYGRGEWEAKDQNTVVLLPSLVTAMPPLKKIFDLNFIAIKNIKFPPPEELQWQGICGTKPWVGQSTSLQKLPNFPSQRAWQNCLHHLMPSTGIDLMKVQLHLLEGPSSGCLTDWATVAAGREVAKRLESSLEMGLFLPSLSSKNQAALWEVICDLP